MKAMIFAAGLGTRLKPLTNAMPKAMVPVNGVPLLQYTIEKLKAAGFDEIIINVHHFAQQIIDFVQEKHSFGIRIAFSDERDKLLDTGGAIKKASWFFDDAKPFLVHNTDILSNVDLAAIYHHHTLHNPAATLLTGARDTSRYLLFDGADKLCGWINKQTGETKPPFLDSGTTPQWRELAFAGVHVISPVVFDYMETFPNRFSIIDFYLSLCGGKEPVLAFTPANLSLLDVGTVESLEEAGRFVTQKLKV